MDPVPQDFRMPAEWEPHAGTWVSWPHRSASWPGRFEPVPDAFARMVAAIAPFEPVYINIGDSEDLRRQAERCLNDVGAPMDRIHFHPIPTNDAWCRDHGPIIVDSDRGQVVLDWDFNAWGDKYEPFESDDAVPARVAKTLDLPVVRPGMVLEGGSIEVNGRGTLITTESCLLNPNRNPSLTRKQIEQHLRHYLGASNIIWLPGGIEGDDTDGHIDDLARFVNPTTIVAAVTDVRSDPDFNILHENAYLLKHAKDQDGQPFLVVPLPTPGVVIVEGERVPASYANFYVANGLVLVPTFQSPFDDLAVDILRRLFPDRLVRGLDATDLIWGLGAFHCLTQQWPESRP